MTGPDLLCRSGPQVSGWAGAPIEQGLWRADPGAERGRHTTRSRGHSRRRGSGRSGSVARVLRRGPRSAAPSRCSVGPGEGGAAVCPVGPHRATPCTDPPRHLPTAPRACGSASARPTRPGTSPGSCAGRGRPRAGHEDLGGPTQATVAPATTKANTAATVATPGALEPQGGFESPSSQLLGSPPPSVGGGRGPLPLHGS